MKKKLTFHLLPHRVTAKSRMASKRSKSIKTLTSPSSSKRSKHPPKRPRLTSSKSSHSTAAETVPDSTFLHQRGCDIPKLLKAVAAFRLRNGISPTALKCIPDFLKEVKDFVPKGLSEKQLLHKLQVLRAKFRKNPNPAGNRRFYKLGLKAWGSRRSVKRDGMKSKRKRAEESEDEDAYWETEESMESGSDEESELLEDEADSPYRYLKRALEDFWVAKKLDLNVLRLALQKVDSVRAKRLDKRFMEIAKDELRLRIEKKRLSNDIIDVLCDGLKGW